MQYKDEAELFGAILNNPELLKTMPVEIKYNEEFINTLYVILEDEILPYIPYQIYEKIKGKKEKKVTKNKNHINKEELELKLLSSPEAINLVSTNEKYEEDFIELMYLLHGDEIKSYFPEEIFNQIKNEEKAKLYHRNYEKDYEKWVLSLRKK